MLTEEQKRLRKTGITGSEIAAVAGINPYEGPLTVWARKLDLIETESTEAMDRGNYLEAGLGLWYAAKTGATIDHVGTICHHSYPLVIATPDGKVVRDGETRGLELKAPTPHAYRYWGEEGTDKIPEWYLPQCTWEAAVLGVARVDVAADMGDRLGIWTVTYDHELFEMLLEKAEQFWRDYVLTQKAPPASAGDREVNTIRQLFPKNSSTDYIDADSELSSMIGRYRTAKEQAKQRENELASYENRLRQIIGDKSGIKCALGRIDYKCNKPSRVVDWESIARAAGATPELISQYTTDKPGARPLRAYFKKE